MYVGLERRLNKIAYSIAPGKVKSNMNTFRTKTCLAFITGINLVCTLHLGFSKSLNSQSSTVANHRLSQTGEGNKLMT